ncbi:MAG: Eco57I restriction-modification methylase domain-containing protein, partial [Bacteroidota bacterium]|nr:Eco57I restriction-modification methylase domain-containing protein [Bacteroidota bacterium]
YAEKLDAINEFETSYGIKKGGFDVVLGNPPYVQIQSMGEMATHLQAQNFITFERTGDLYGLFYELGNTILKQNGLLGFITSNKWMRANYGKKLRNYFVKHTNPKILIDLGSGIFESATVDSNILIFEKEEVTNYFLTALNISKKKVFTSFDELFQQSVILNELSSDIWAISNPIEQQIKKKIEKVGMPLKKWNIEINYGLKTGLNDAFIIDESKKEELIQKEPKSAEIIKPVLRGKDINRYNIGYKKLYLINSHNGDKENARINIDEYPAIKEHLNQFYTKLEKRYDKGTTPYNLRNCAYLSNFEKEKIIWKEMSSDTPFCIDKNKFFTNDTITFITGDNLYFLIAVLNSKLNFYSFSNFYSGGGLGNKGVRFKKEFISKIPVPKIDKENQQPFIEKADLMLSLNKELQTKSEKFIKRIKSNLEIEKITNKLQNFYNFDFKTFVSELKKQKIKLTFTQQDEWEDYFDNYKTEINDLQNQINQTDKEIDKMVYELYELTSEEIEIVENSVK